MEQASLWYGFSHLYLITITILISNQISLETLGQGLRCCPSSRHLVALLIKSLWLSLLLNWCSDVGCSLEPPADLASTSVDLDFTILEHEPTPRNLKSLLEGVCAWPGVESSAFRKWMWAGSSLETAGALSHLTNPPRRQATARDTFIKFKCECSSYK